MKSILFGSKRNLKIVKELDIRYKETKIKQHKHDNYLGWLLDDTMSGEKMALRVMEKLNSRLISFIKKLDFRCSPS